MLNPLRSKKSRVPSRSAGTRVKASASEVDPRKVGVRVEAVEAVWEAAERLYDTGLHPAISICIRRGGEVVLDRAIGHASGNGPDDGPGRRQVPVTPNTPFCVFSVSKAITAMLIHLLDDRGVLHVGDRVVEYIPEFGRHGKEWVTLRHVLTHRAGLPSVGGGSEDLSLLGSWEGIVQRLCDSELVARAGRRLAYHAISGGFVLGEVVRRVTGRDIRTFLAEEVLDPLGFAGLNYGVPPELVDRVATNYFTGPPVLPPVSWGIQRALGVSLPEAAEISNTEAFLSNILPSANVVGTANELSRFFELLLRGGELDGVRVFSPRTIRRATNETSYLELDLTMGLPIRFGVGLMLGGRWLSPFGPDTGRAFGHLGLINIHAWADPTRDLAVAILTTGKPLVGGHLRPLWGLLSQVSASFPKRF